MRNYFAGHILSTARDALRQIYTWYKAGITSGSYKTDIRLIFASAHTRLLGSLLPVFITWYQTKAYIPDQHVQTSVGQFLNADSVLNLVLKMKINWHFYMWEPKSKPSSGSHIIENRSWELIQIYIYIYIFTFFREPDKFSHRTHIQFSEFSVSFIGSSCSCSHLGAATLLQLLLFSHRVALFVWWSN